MHKIKSKFKHVKKLLKNNTKLKVRFLVGSSSLLLLVIGVTTYFATYSDLILEFNDDPDYVESSVKDNKVIINEVESDYYYYKSLNYTSNDGTLPTTDNKDIYNDNNLVQTKITYKGNDGTNKGYVSLSERQDTYVYFKMFEVNDKVVYGIVGVCEVEDIAAPPIKGIEGDYYFLQPVYDDKGIIYSPVNSTKVQIRSIISKNECEKIIEKAKNCVKDELLNEKLSPAKYDEIVKSQDIEQLMHLVRHLYNIKNERAKDLRKMKSADSRTLSLARKLLYGEIAAASGKELTEVTHEMDAYLGI